MPTIEPATLLLPPKSLCEQERKLKDFCDPKNRGSTQSRDADENSKFRRAGDDMMPGMAESCRYCRESFDPQPDKPGYIDECPDCLFERTAAQRLKPSPNEKLIQKQVPGLRKKLSAYCKSGRAVDRVIEEYVRLMRTLG